LAILFGSKKIAISLDANYLSAAILVAFQSAAKH